VSSHELAGEYFEPDIPAARAALTDGLTALRRMLSTALHGEGGGYGTRRRADGAPETDQPDRRSPAAPTQRPNGQRTNGQRAPGQPAHATRPAHAEPVTLDALDLDRATGPEPPSGPERPSGQHPQRHDPSGPAADVWVLVERAQAGDVRAFALIYDRYLDVVYRYVYFRVNNKQLAEDLTSETFLRALRRIASVSWQGRDFGAWLVTIARNLVVDYYKSGRYRLEVTTGDVIDAEREDRAPEGRPETAVVDHLTNVALLTAVKQLNPEQQECIVLRFLQGFSVAETAQAMGKNEGAIKALQYRAVRALLRLLPEGFQP
jgi:RNA polymerase sigma-70 factor, ECF subfamily